VVSNGNGTTTDAVAAGGRARRIETVAQMLMLTVRATLSGTTERQRRPAKSCLPPYAISSQFVLVEASSQKSASTLGSRRL
jgi:hypothetical protein